jgi:large subunit ribosomal protein L23
MGIFSRTKTPSAKTTNENVTPAVLTGAHATDYNLMAVIEKPHLTEKAMSQNERNVYTFMVAKNATKYTVAQAVKEVYKVTPVKVNIVNKLPNKSMSGARGRMVSQKGYKKAYVYLKKGDTINVV